MLDMLRYSLMDFSLAFGTNPETIRIKLYIDIEFIAHIKPLKNLAFKKTYGD